MNRILLMLIALVLSACSEADPVPERKVKAPRTEPLGYEYAKHVVVSERYQPMWVQLLTTGYTKHPKTAKNDNFKVVDQLVGCVPEKASPDHQVINIHIPSSKSYVNMTTYTREDFVKTVSKFVKKYKKGPITERTSSFLEYKTMTLTDVFVSEVPKPVHLILTGNHKIWNINASEGASILRITLFGNGVALANAPADAKVEFLTGSRMQDCDIVPGRKPQPHWRVVENKFKDIEEKHYRRYRKFARWYDDTFGLRHDKHLVTPLYASHVLVGKIPGSLDKRRPYKSFVNSELLVPKGTNYVALSGKEFRKQYFQKVHDAAAEQAGGDLSALRPDS